MKMVKGFESMLAGSLDLEEPWYIPGAEFNPVKNVIDVYVGIWENAVIALSSLWRSDKALRV